MPSRVPPCRDRPDAAERAAVAANQSPERRPTSEDDPPAEGGADSLERGILERGGWCRQGGPQSRVAACDGSAVSSVLDSAPPQFTAEDAARIAAEVFGVHGTASALGSERDQAFLLENGVLKISNPSEDEAVLDLEEAAIAHVAAFDPGLPVARPLAPRATFDGHQV